MSLLMDALKKAEQEKKDSAKKLISADDEFSITHNDAAKNSTDSHPVISTTTPQESELDQTDRTYNTSAMDLRLEPLELNSQHPLIAKRPAEKLLPEMLVEITGPVATPDSFTESLSLKPEFNDFTAEPEIDADKTQEVKLKPADMKLISDPDQTFHGASFGQSSDAGLYEDTVQGEAYRPGDINQSYDETLPGVPAAQLARDIGTQDQPTPVAAQTLFAATNTVTKTSSGFRILLISLCVLAVASTIVVYYFSVTPVSRNIPSPLVARGVETTLPGQDLQTIADIKATVAAETIATPEAKPTEIVAPIEPAATPAPNAAAVINETSAPSTQTTENSTITATETVSTATPDRNVPDESLPATIKPPEALVRITRSVNPTNNNQLVVDAFRDYQQGNYVLAGQKYLQAYEHTPDNRDVLLGLAAVATKTGDTIRALQIYMHLVELNPLDNVARAALLGLQPGKDISASISAVKSMLFETPEQPSLYFTLGKLYAAQSSWNEAQQAFFDAYRLDSSNPDYAYNLAVSLDRLEQRQSALDYYTVALGLAETGSAGFNSAAVSERIKSLEAGK